MVIPSNHELGIRPGEWFSVSALLWKSLVHEPSEPPGIRFRLRQARLAAAWRLAQPAALAPEALQRGQRSAKAREVLRPSPRSQAK